MCCALTGNCLLYGKFDPYLSSHIDLVEHCYIRGPGVQSIGAIQLYAKLSKFHYNITQLHSAY